MPPHSQAAMTLEPFCAQALLITHPSHLCTVDHGSIVSETNIGCLENFAGKHVLCQFLYCNSECLVKRMALQQLPTEFPDESLPHFIIAFLLFKSKSSNAYGVIHRSVIWEFWSH